MVKSLMEKFVTALKALELVVLFQIITNMSGFRFFSFKIALFS